MASAHLATYLNDHLSGSGVALELLAHLERAHAGTAIATFAAGLRAEIAADRRELEALMARLGVARSSPRRAAAWASAKSTELKLVLDDPSGRLLRLLEVFEALSLGVEGKRLLWRSLAAVSTSAGAAAAFEVLDLPRLERRAEDQRRDLEILRLEAAKAALALGGGPA